MNDRYYLIFFFFFCNLIVIINHAYDRINETMSPYNPRASAKIKIKMSPTKTLSSCALAFTPASPTIPIANPAAMQLKPQDIPAAI